MSVTRELALSKRVEELEQKTATRNALIKSQAERIERLRATVRVYQDAWGNTEIMGGHLKPGDMGEPT